MNSLTLFLRDIMDLTATLFSCVVHVTIWTPNGFKVICMGMWVDFEFHSSPNDSQTVMEFGMFAFS